MGLMSRLIASTSLVEVSRNVFLMRWIMHVWTMASGHMLPTTSGSPFSPSQTRKNTSRTPRFFRSVSTLIQKPGALAAGARPQAQHVLAAVYGDADGRVDGPVGHLAVPDLDHDGVEEDRHID